MKLTLLLTGKTSFAYINDGLSIYKKRLAFYIPFNIVELPDIKGTSSLTKEQVKQKEGEAMLKFIKRSDTLILLDERGESFTSVQWAAFFGETDDCKSGERYYICNRRGVWLFR